MTITKLFNDTFKKTLIDAGFLRSGKLYLRKKGITIQTVLFEDISPFRICYSVYPFWCHRLVGIKCNQTLEMLKKPWWAEGLIETMGVFCRDGDDIEIQNVMKLCLKVFIDEILPYFDSHTDEESCLAASLEEFTVVSASECVLYKGSEYWAHTRIGAWKNQYLLLWKAYMDGTFEHANKLYELDVRNYRESEQKQLMQNYAQRKDFQRNIEEHIAILAETCPEMSPEEAYNEAYRIWGPNDSNFELMVEENCKKMINSHYYIFLTRLQENDLSWIKGVRDIESKVMKTAFEDVYGIRFD